MCDYDSRVCILTQHTNYAVSLHCQEGQQKRIDTVQMQLMHSTYKISYKAFLSQCRSSLMLKGNIPTKTIYLRNAFKNKLL